MSKEGKHITLRRATAASVAASLDSAIPTAQTAITIAVDVNYIATLPAGQNPGSKGIYMMDNRVLNGSSNEGNFELSTKCPTGNLISFAAVPINAEAGTASNTKVEIIGFNVSSGNVFTAAGQPRPFNPPPDGGTNNSFWIGQAMNQGSQTYQIQLKVTVGVLQPVSHFVSWDPFITAT
jgi:hypothetical protein